MHASLHRAPCTRCVPFLQRPAYECARPPVLTLPETLQEAPIEAGQPRHVLSSASAGAAASTAQLLKCAFQPVPPGQKQPAAPLIAACSGSESDADHQCAVYVWDSASGALQRRFETGTRAVPDLAWSPCGMLLAAAALDATLRVWDVTTGVQRAELPLPAVALSVTWHDAGNVCVGMAGGLAKVLTLSASGIC